MGMREGDIPKKAKINQTSLHLFPNFIFNGV